METIHSKSTVNVAVKIGSILFLIWGVLHLYVGVAGVVAYAAGDLKALWTMLLGGANAPVAQFQVPTDAVTAHAQAQLILNFVIDVGAAGVLGFFVAWILWNSGSWTGYLIGLVVIGIIDNAFLFAMVVPGIIVGDLATWGGPLIWLAACIVTPFGLTRRGKRK